MKNKDKKEKNTNKRDNIFMIILSFCDVIAVTVLFLLYGPYNGFRDWLVTTAMGTMNHQYLATTFYNMDRIEEILSHHSTVEPDFDTDTSLITADENEYIDDYDREILDRNKNDIYKLIEIDEDGYSGYLAAVYDPSKIKVTYSKNLGVTGEYLVNMAKREGAVLAINGGGFADAGGQGNGGAPVGAIISGGKIISNYGTSQYGGGIVGFTNDNKLYLGKISATEAINIGIRDAVDWGPYLIVDGDNKFKDIDYFTWVCARTAIGQRKDGIVLMVVIDGLQSHSAGASYADMAKIMETYGAVNAANLDGGTSTAMTYNHEYINSPWNGYKRTYRYLPNAFIVTE